MAITLKALVDKQNSRVVFVESDEDFVDVLLSFLTMPLGTIVRITSNQTPAMRIGCMNNLYKSVENLDVKYFPSENCRTMLRRPRNGAASLCERLKVNVEHEGWFSSPPSIKYFCCQHPNCTASMFKLLSYFPHVSCHCGGIMEREIYLLDCKSKNASSKGLEGGVFVKGLSRFVISDELSVMPASTATSFSLLSNAGVMDVNAAEERSFSIGVAEVVKLLKCSFVSKRPLTETLLQHEAVPETRKEDFDPASYFARQIEEHESKGNGKIRIRLMVSKSRKTVCFAEGSEDFINLLFSFLTIPLGYVLEWMHDCPAIGCLNHLRKSAQDLDAEKYLKSEDHKEILLSPKIAPGFGYEDQPLGLEVAYQQYFYYEEWVTESERRYNLANTRALVPSDDSVKVSVLSLMDPKLPHKEAESGGGFVVGPAMFTITDDLMITPISPISSLSVLSKLKVPLSDLEERFVHVGNEEASRLLLATFLSESALTDAFVGKVPKKDPEDFF